MLFLLDYHFGDITKSIFSHAGEVFKTEGLKLLIQIGFFFCKMVYNLITKLYSVFLAIGSSQLVSSDVIQGFMTRMYIIVSVVMLFILAYSFMNMIVNPDNAAKKDSSPTKIVRNVILSLLLIVFVPAAFRFAYSIQNAIISDQVINRIVLGATTEKIEDRSNANKYGQSEFAVALFESNFYINNPEGLDCDLIENDQSTECSFRYARQLAIDNGDINYYSFYISDVQEGSVTFNFLLAMALGVFTVYVLIVYCFDIAVRAIKLFLLEIIAPVPALLMIVPGQGKIFTSWLKATSKAFLEIFLKIAILTFGLFFINTVVQSLANGALSMQFSEFSTGVKYTAQAFIIFGVVLFIKQAPGLISDIFGIKMEKGSLSLKKRLTDSGALAALGLGLGAGYAFAGGAKGAMARGKKRWKFGGALGSGIASMARGALTGARAGYKGNFKGIGAAYGEAQDTQLYRARRGNGFGSTFSVIGDQLRDNMGIDSVYDEEVKLAQISKEAEIRSRKDALTSFKNASRKKSNEISNIATEANNRNHQALDTLKGALDKNKEETFKEGSTTRTNVVLPTNATIDYTHADSGFGVELGSLGDNLSAAFDEFGISNGTWKGKDGVLHANHHALGDIVSQINSRLATTTDAGEITRLNDLKTVANTYMGMIASDTSADKEKLQLANVNAQTLKKYESDLIDMFVKGGYSEAQAAQLASIWSQRFKSSYDRLEEINATSDLASGIGKSKLMAEIAKFQDLIRSDSFGGTLKFDAASKETIKGSDSAIIALAAALKDKDLSTVTGEELYTFLTSLRKLDASNLFEEQEALRNSEVEFIGLDHKKRKDTLSRGGEDAKEWEEFIKKAEEELKNKIQALEDHKNNQHPKKGG